MIIAWITAAHLALWGLAIYFLTHVLVHSQATGIDALRDVLIGISALLIAGRGMLEGWRYLMAISHSNEHGR